ncbi:MAG: winged helix-turn-helix domain-containing protein [Nanoarchaeota archaeon]
MSAKRRTKIEIIHDILKAIQNKGGRIKPTHLLYKSNLSHKKMMEYVDDLLKKGMIREEHEAKSNNKKYTITNKGLQYLVEFKQIQQFSDAFGIN